MQSSIEDQLGCKGVVAWEVDWIFPYSSSSGILRLACRFTGDSTAVYPLGSWVAGELIFEPWIQTNVQCKIY